MSELLNTTSIFFRVKVMRIRFFNSYECYDFFMQWATEICYVCLIVMTILIGMHRYEILADTDNH